jgi:hypothetical protein
MKVRELIEMLEDCDPEADVLMMSQPSWPFEWSIDGVISRDEIPSEEPDEDEEEDDDEDEDDDDERANGRKNDVFILEGRQLRYGSKAAWGGR